MNWLGSSSASVGQVQTMSSTFSLYVSDDAAGGDWRGRGHILCLSMLAVIGALAGAIQPAFLSAPNLSSILHSTALIMPAVLSTQALLLLGRFDLSLGAIAALAGVVVAMLSQEHPLAVALAGGAAVGIIVGGANGLAIARYRVDPLIATLATMGMARSIASVVSDGRVVTSASSGLAALGGATVSFLSPVVVLAFCLLLVAEWAFRAMRFFRRFYVIGGNLTAATHSGIRVVATTVLAYCLASFGAVLTAVLQVARTSSASSNSFPSLALETIAACLVGGATLTGGRGTMTGSALGALVVVASRNVVLMLGVSVFWQDFAIGALLLFAAGGSTMRWRRQVAGATIATKEEHSDDPR